MKANQGKLNRKGTKKWCLLSLPLVLSCFLIESASASSQPSRTIVLDKSIIEIPSSLLVDQNSIEFIRNENTPNTVEILVNQIPYTKTGTKCIEYEPNYSKEAYQCGGHAVSTRVCATGSGCKNYDQWKYDTCYRKVKIGYECTEYETLAQYTNAYFKIHFNLSQVHSSQIFKLSSTIFLEKSTNPYSVHFMNANKDDRIFIAEKGSFLDGVYIGNVDISSITPNTDELCYGKYLVSANGKNATLSLGLNTATNTKFGTIAFDIFGVNENLTNLTCRAVRSGAALLTFNRGNQTYSATITRNAYGVTIEGSFSEDGFYKYSFKTKAKVDEIPTCNGKYFIEVDGLKAKLVLNSTSGSYIRYKKLRKDEELSDIDCHYDELNKFTKLSFNRNFQHYKATISDNGVITGTMSQDGVAYPFK